MSSRTAHPGASATVEWPLVGRARELHDIRRLVCVEHRGVVLAGRAGVGKSRLCQEALEQARAAGRRTVRVAATRSSSGIPLGAFASLLPTTVLGDRAPDERAALLRRCVDDLVARAEGQTMVLGVDDAHLLDDMSATLVHQLADSGAVLVIATLRSGDHVPDPIAGLWQGSTAERIEVSALGPAEVSEVLTRSLDGRVDEAAVTELMSRSRGNMLFLRELVTGALVDDALRDDGGLWRLVGELHPTDRLVELVESRLAGLSSVERGLMEIVALGEPLGLEELARLADEDVAEGLERKALIRTSVDGIRTVLRLAHPLYGDVLRERMPSLRARRIARSLAESLEAAGRHPGDLLRIATWRLRGGGAEPSLMHEAAVEARWRYDFGLAERLARAAVEGGAGFESALLAAQLASLQGRTEQADTELAELSDQARDPSEQGRIILTRLDNRVIYSGSIEEGLRITEESRTVSVLPDMRDEIVARRAALLLASEGPRSAVEAVSPLLLRASGRALAWACMPGAYSLARMGRLDEALNAARRGMRVQSELASPTDWYPFMHAFYEAEALTYAGRFAEAASAAASHYHEGVQNRSLEQQGLFSWQMAKSTADRGDVTESVDAAQQAISIYRQLGRPQFVNFCLIYLAQALAVGGRVTEARSSLAELDRLTVAPSYFMGSDLLTSRAWTEAAGGNLNRAREIFGEAAEQGERIGDLVGALTALHGVARVGRPGGVRARMESLGVQVEGALAAARVAHVRALDDADAGALFGVSGAFEEMGATLLAAESAADASVCCAHDRDQRGRASGERRAATLAARCAGVNTPALRALEGRARLTRAEWEAAHLAAAGLSNRDIAGELVISVRTVENRLQSVYHKLGVRSRQSLATTLDALDARPDRSPA